MITIKIFKKLLISDTPKHIVITNYFVGIIARQPRMTAINSCIEVDLTGQVVSDSIGTRMYSGFGGQVDFIRGAAEGLDGLGKPIIALPSSTNKGESKISPLTKPGKNKLNFVEKFL